MIISTALNLRFWMSTDDNLHGTRLTRSEVDVVERLDDLRRHVTRLDGRVRLNRMGRLDQPHLHAVALALLFDHQCCVTFCNAGIVGGFDHVVPCIVFVENGDG